MPSGIPKGKKKLSDKELEANAKINIKKYRSGEKYKVTQKKWEQSGGKKASNDKYRFSDEGKATRNKYEQSEHGKALKKIQDKKFQSSELGDAAIQLKVLQYYSKLHSNSDIACCRCCGLNDHTDF